MGEAQDLLALYQHKLADMVGENLGPLVIQRTQEMLIEVCRQAMLRWKVELIWSLQVNKDTGVITADIDGKTEADRERWSSLLAGGEGYGMFDPRPLGRFVK